MAQHFLLSAQARTLSLKEIYKGGEDKAYQAFKKLRWAATDGNPSAVALTITKSTPAASSSALLVMLNSA